MPWPPSRTERWIQTRREGYALGSLCPARFRTVTRIRSIPSLRSPATAIVAAFSWRFARVRSTVDSSSAGKAVTPSSVRWALSRRGMRKLPPRNTCAMTPSRSSPSTLETSAGPSTGFM